MLQSKTRPWIHQSEEYQMKAAFIERHGGPEVLKFGEMPDPVAASGEVVVDIVAASVNGADWKVREGKSNRISRFPYILGRDLVSRMKRVIEIDAGQDRKHVGLQERDQQFERGQPTVNASGKTPPIQPIAPSEVPSRATKPAKTLSVM
jgi:hypothetical protein